MLAKLRELTFNRDGSQNVTLTVCGDFSALYESMDGKEVDVEIKPHRRKRSLSANAYAWVLTDKISAAINQPKEDVYRETIRNIGGVSDVVCVQNRAVEAIRSGWEAHGIGWITDTLPSKLPDCTNVILYYGSSTYDTAQMSRLIDLLVQEAKELGIETATPAELARLKEEWARHDQQHHAG